jgi:ABC-type transport system involved in multi-copper enzyme maturation permease subunit
MSGVTVVPHPALMNMIFVIVLVVNAFKISVMNKIFLFLMIIVFVSTAQAQNSVIEQVASKMAQRMSDSLGLNSRQKNQLYDVNLNLNNQKLAAKQQYANTDSLYRFLRVIENKRDSLYRPILTEQQFSLYIQKKRSLLGGVN